MMQAAALYLPTSQAVKSTMINERDCKWKGKSEIMCTSVKIFIQTRYILHKNYVEMLQIAEFNFVNDLMYNESEGTAPYLATKCVCT
jgi:hypothetical protein